MSVTLGLAHRGEYPEPVEAEFDGIVAPLQVFLSNLNAALASADSTAAVFTVPLYGPVGIQANTGSRQLTAAESGLILTNEGDTDGSAAYLPTAAEGLIFTFTLVEAQAMAITAATGDTIRILGSSGTVASASALGDSVTLVALSPQRWFAVSYVGVWGVS